ncbi:MAG: AIR synthase family protein, partial [Candidatus Micrarchaeota archaeon]|nr:AIR synthase family protein [Candidatus Micrarchaeota archaeon]
MADRRAHWAKGFALGLRLYLTGDDMSNPLGKIPKEFFDRVILPRLGAKDGNVVVGPQHGVDCGVIKIGGKYLVVESDPFYIAKELGMRDAAWFAVNILASDVAVMGARPKYLIVDLNLPMEMSDSEIEEMWGSVHSECKRLGIAIPAGHTARYPGCNFPMVGGASMIGIAEEYITPGMARAGDKLIVTKGAAIEASALLASFFYERVKERIGKHADDARKLVRKMSVVDDALTSFACGGVHAMHDATECGVYGGVLEMAIASKVGVRLDKDAIIVRPEVAKICELFKIDPYISISEG